jgi:hypothetical protein
MSENALPSPVHVVLDRDARVRTGPPEFRSTTTRIPYWTRVWLNETGGEYVRVTGADGTAYGWTAASNVGTFFKDLPHLASAPLAPSQPAAAGVARTDLARALADTYGRLGGLMALVGLETGIPLAAALAVWYVESAGRRHPVGRAIIRFENHLFFDRWGSAHPDVYDRHFQHGGRAGVPDERWKNHRWREDPSQPFATFHGSQDAEYRVLAFATRLSSEDTALQCISIGGSQILVSNYAMIGYDGARAMYDAFQADERAHVLGFLDFCNYRYGHGARRGELLRDLAALRWEDFARGYNGGGQVALYAGHLRNAHAEAVRVLPAAPAPAAAPTRGAGSAAARTGDVATAPESLGIPGEVIAPPRPLQQWCGFSGQRGLITEADLREAIRAEATAELRNWRNFTGTALFRESLNRQFGHLVRYWLARFGTIRPSTLTAAQARAIQAIGLPGGGVNYGQLLTNGPVSNANLAAAKRQARIDLLAGAPVGAPANLEAIVEEALGWARDSKLDDEDRGPWSAVFVVACVRQVAIRLGLEGEAANVHVGQDELLLAHQRHRDYVVEAHRRRFGPGRRDGTYHAFRIGERRVQVGDIIVQDREDVGVHEVWLFDDIPALARRSRKMHADIVVEVARDHVVTIGGNLTNSVRRRRYPMTPQGLLVIDWNQLYTQEDDNLILPNLPVRHAPETLHPFSTWRIFALLSLVQQCGIIPGQRVNGGVLT